MFEIVKLLVWAFNFPDTEQSGILGCLPKRSLQIKDKESGWTARSQRTLKSPWGIRFRGKFWHKRENKLSIKLRYTEFFKFLFKVDKFYRIYTILSSSILRWNVLIITVQNCFHSTLRRKFRENNLSRAEIKRIPLIPTLPVDIKEKANFYRVDLCRIPSSLTSGNILIKSGWKTSSL